MPATKRRPHIYGDLYDLLEAKFPQYKVKENTLNVTKLAEDMGRSHEALYRALRKDSMTVTIAESILKYSRLSGSNDPIFLEDLAPFILEPLSAYAKKAKEDLDGLL